MQSILRRVVIKPEEKRNVLWFGLDGEFESLFSEVNANFYLVPELLKNSLVRLPKNFFRLQSINNLPISFDFDCVVTNERVQLDVAFSVASNLHLPLIHVEHNERIPNAADEQYINLMARNNIQVSCTQDICNQWNIGGRIIPYGIPFSTKQNNLHKNVFVIGNFNQQEISIIHNIIRDYPKELVCINQNFPDGVFESDGIFLNLSGPYNIPVPLLKAMQNGLVIISNKTFVLDKYLKDGYNSLVGSSMEEIHDKLHTLLRNFEPRKKLLEQAKNTFLNINNTNFVNQWNQLLQDITKITYIRSNG